MKKDFSVMSNSFYKTKTIFQGCNKTLAEGHAVWSTQPIFHLAFTHYLYINSNQLFIPFYLADVEFNLENKRDKII